MRDVTTKTAPDPKELWTQVDAYFASHLHAEDASMSDALRASAEAGLPAIQVPANIGKLLCLLAMIQGSRRILEIGTLGGYSTIWLAKALPRDGRVITLEREAKHAEVARRNFVRAGLDAIIQIRVGPALETLPRLATEELGPFDMVFIDADKANNAEYIAWSLKLARPGTIIVVDNVVRSAAVIDGASDDESVRGVRRLAEFLAGCPRVSATALQIVGGKGHDGLVIAVVGSEP